MTGSEWSAVVWSLRVLAYIFKWVPWLGRWLRQQAGRQASSRLLPAERTRLAKIEIAFLEVRYQLTSLVLAVRRNAADDQSIRFILPTLSGHLTYDEKTWLPLRAEFAYLPHDLMDSCIQALDRLSWCTEACGRSKGRNVKALPVDSDIEEYRYVRWTIDRSIIAVDKVLALLRFYLEAA